MRTSRRRRSFSPRARARPRSRPAAEIFPADQLAVFTTLARRSVFSSLSLDARLKGILEAAAAILNVERVGLWRFSDDRSELRCLALYERTPRRLSSGISLVSSRYPAYFRALEGSDVVAADRAFADPRTREFKDDYLKPLGITSMLDVPLRALDRVFGVLCHEHVGAPRRWRSAEQACAVGLGHCAFLLFESLERRRIEADLRAASALAEQRLEDKELLLQHTWDVIYQSDTSGVFTYVSPACERMTGYTPKEWLVHYSTYMTDNPINKRAAAYIDYALSTGAGPPPFLVEMRRRDGKPVLMEVVMHPFRKEGRIAGIIGVARDVTDRRLAEVELQRLVGLLSRSNRDLQDFASFASHDLKAPLRKIAAFAGFLAGEEKGRLAPASRAHLDAILRNTRRMQELIDSLLTYARLGQAPIQPRRTDLNKTIAAVLESLSREVSECAATVTVGDLPQVLGEDALLQRVFENLISNALKFRSAAAPIVSIEARPEGPQWIIAVRDNGIGIPPKRAEEAFTPFRRLQGEAGPPGSGIGLSICRRIIERLGGRIWAEPSPGGGTTVQFALPGAPPQA